MRLSQCHWANIYYLYILNIMSDVREKNQQSIVLIHGSCSLRVIHIFVSLTTSHSAKKKKKGLQPRFFSCFVFGDRLVSSVWSSCFSLPSSEVVGRYHYNPAMTKMSSSLSPSLPPSLLAALDFTMWTELTEIHLWLPLQCWDQRRVLPQPTRMRISNQVYLILNLIYTVTHWHYCGSLFNVYNDWAVCWQIWHFNSSHHISIIIMEKNFGKIRRTKPILLYIQLWIHYYFHFP